MPLNKTLITFIMLAVSWSSPAQTFEGKVTYKLEIKKADPHLPDSIFNMMYAGMPELTQVYYYKDNYYKSITEGQPVRSIQLYEPATNKVYGYTEGAEVAFWHENNTVTSIKTLKVKEDIMGISCTAIVIKYETGELTLYYNAAYRIDITSFAEDNLWEKYLREAEAIPLKYVIKGGPAKHYVVLTATEVQEEKLDDNFFKLPPFKQVMRSLF